MSLGENMPESLPKALAEALAKSLPRTRAEPPPGGGVISRQSRIVNSESETYRKRRHDALDNNHYHADVDTQFDVGTTTYDIGQAPGPQFCRGVGGPETASPVASADTALDTTNPATAGAS